MQSHIEKGKKNEKFLSLIEEHGKNDYLDWNITVCFYSALHYVKAYLKKHGYNTNSHKEIDQNIRHTSLICNVKFDEKHYRAYADLKTYSSTARYSGVYSGPLQELLLKNNSIESKKFLSLIKLYLTSKGMKLI